MWIGRGVRPGVLCAAAAVLGGCEGLASDGATQASAIGRGEPGCAGPPAICATAACGHSRVVTEEFVRLYRGDARCTSTCLEWQGAACARPEISCDESGALARCEVALIDLERARRDARIGRPQPGAAPRFEWRWKHRKRVELIEADIRPGESARVSVEFLCQAEVDYDHSLSCPSAACGCRARRRGRM
jgi:hypothetical protein